MTTGTKRRRGRPAVPQAEVPRTDPNQPYTVEEVSRLLRLHRNTVQAMAQKGMAGAFKAGREWRFPADFQERLRAEQAGEPAAEPGPEA